MTGLFSEVFLGALLFGAVTAGDPAAACRPRRADVGEGRRPQHRHRGHDDLAAPICGFVGAFYSGSLWLGFLTGALGGMAVALVMALLCVRLGLNQIVIGIALTLGLEGLTALLHHFQFSRSYPRLPAADATVIPVLSDIPVLGPALFKHHLLVYLAVALVVVHELSSTGAPSSA